MPRPVSLVPITCFFAASGLSTTTVLRYRCNAVSLGRAFEQARLILQALEEKRQEYMPILRVLPSPPLRHPCAEIRTVPDLRPAYPSRQKPSRHRHPGQPPMDTEAMKREARAILAAFSKHLPRPISRSQPSPSRRLRQFARGHGHWPQFGQPGAASHSMFAVGNVHRRALFA